MKLFLLIIGIAFLIYSAYITIKYLLQFKFVGDGRRCCRKCHAIQYFIPGDEFMAPRWHEPGITWEDGSEEKLDETCSCHKYEA